MEMPNGRIYTYHSHPNVPVPSKEEIVRFVIGGRYSVKTNLYRGHAHSLRFIGHRLIMSPVLHLVWLSQNPLLFAFLSDASKFGIISCIVYDVTLK